MPAPLCLILATGLIVLVGVARTPASPTLQEDLGQRQAAFLAGLAAKDAARTSALFADDAVLHVANMAPVRGRPAIEQFYARLFGFLTSSEATSERLRVSAGGDMAYDVGVSRNAFKGNEGASEYVGKYLTVWVKDQGTWRIAAYSVSSNSGPR